MNFRCTACKEIVTQGDRIAGRCLHPDAYVYAAASGSLPCQLEPLEEKNMSTADQERLTKQYQQFDRTQERLERLYQQIDKVLEVNAQSGNNANLDDVAQLAEQQRKLLSTLTLNSVPGALLEKGVQVLSDFLAEDRGRFRDLLFKALEALKSLNEGKGGD
jgi:hypothetical protein